MSALLDAMNRNQRAIAAVKVKAEVEKLGPVNCAGCTACCRGAHYVTMFPPEDNHLDYDTVIMAADPNVVEDIRATHPAALVDLDNYKGVIPPDEFAQMHASGNGLGVYILRLKPNGDCVYLGENGCTIYDRRPRVCREFDCRVMYRKLSNKERKEWVRAGTLSPKVFDAGRKRLAQRDAT